MSRRRVILIVAAAVVTSALLFSCGSAMALNDYADELETLVLAPWREGFDQLGPVLEIADFGAIYSAEWRADIADAMATIQVGNANLRGIDVPEEYVEAHGTLLDAAFEFDAMAVLMAEAIDERDLDKIGVALEAGARGRDHMVRGRDLLPFP